jgi:hypothetical protein
MSEYAGIRGDDDWGGLDDEGEEAAGEQLAGKAPATRTADEAQPPDVDESPDVVGTGDYRVDVALSRLAELPGLPVVEHVAVYDDVHAQIQSALADLDER